MTEDTDLFVGSRSVPGAYGWSPAQFLLENDGKGHFKDVTDIRMIGLRSIGMVTDADWVDYDNDGDMDIIAGNLGLNSMLKASVKEPVEMYLNDFDNNGVLDQVICSYQNGISFPVSSVDELESQIAGLDKKYPNYSDFGGKTVNELFGKEVIDKSVIKKAQIFESCLFLNNGDGTFKITKLPVFAQFSPVRDILTRDIDGDGTIDIVLAGNNYSVRPSYGRYDASYGLFLKGDTSHSYTTLLSEESGLIIKGDARKIVTIEVSGKQYMIVSVNNADLQIFRLF